MANPDISLIATSFVENGGQVFGKHVLDWDLRAEGIQVRTNVKAPQPLTKLSAVGGPQPYRLQDDFSGNGVKYTDRILTAYQSKWDSQFDFEQFRNGYLAESRLKTGTAAQEANNQMAKEYLDKLQLNTLGLGVYNGSGTAVADICDGWLTILAADITATRITPNSTVGAITESNAVEAVETLIEESVPVWMRKMGFIIYCSYGTLDKYRKAYRSSFGFTFDKNVEGTYKLDNLNVTLRPQPWMLTSQRLIATLPNNLVLGTDIEAAQVYATPHLNIIETRLMMPLGCQIQDLGAMAVNDQA